MLLAPRFFRERFIQVVLIIKFRFSENIGLSEQSVQNLDENAPSLFGVTQINVSTRSPPRCDLASCNSARTPQLLRIETRT